MGLPFNMFTQDINLKPQGILDRFALFIHRRINRMKERAGVVDDTMDPKGPPTSPPLISFDEPWKHMQEDSDRHQTAVEAWRAYENDSRVEAAVTAWGDHGTAADNQGRVMQMVLGVEKEDDARVSDIFDRLKQVMMKRLRLESIAPQILKRAFLEGNAYREIVLNSLGSEIVAFREVPGAREGYVMRKLENKITKQHVGWALYNVAMGNLAATYAPWQIVQFSWNKFMHYGKSGIGAARIDVERAAESEDAMHKARDERAYVKFGHIYKDVPAEQLKNIKAEDEAERARNPRGVQTDFYSNNDIKMFDPSNAQLANIEDVAHGERKIMTGAKYPKGFLGGHGDNINRAVLEKQEENLIRSLSKANQMLSEGFREAADFQLLLWSIIPEEVPYWWQWTEKSVSDVAEQAQAFAIAVERIGLSPQSALEEMGFNPEVEQRRIEAWREWESGLGSPEEDRLNAEILALRASMNGDGDENNNGSRADPDAVDSDSTDINRRNARIESILVKRGQPVGWRY